LKELEMIVSERAAIARINRSLAKEMQRLLVCKWGSRWHSSLGRFYLVDLARNAVDTTNIDLEALGRELGVLRPNESVAGS
jgi:hypothetical protein